MMKNLHLLVKPASSACNLRCGYCFYEDASNNRAVKNSGVMSPALADTLLRQAYGLCEDGGTVNFTFQGGEPTLAGLEFFRYFAAQAHALCPAGVRTEFAIQTNGVLLNEEWAAFLKRENFLVGLSVDGCKELHNLYRVNARKNGSWNAVCRALQLLQGQGVLVNALCVVTAQAARRPEKIYNELKKLGLGYMQFIPCLDPIGQTWGKQPFSLAPKAYGDFLCRLFDLWYADWAGGQYHSIRLFDDYVNLLLGSGEPACASCGRCGGYFVVESDGSLYPCDFYALDEWKLGSLAEQPLAELIEGERAQAFLRWRQEKPAECAGCRWSPLCGGGCKRDWVDAEDGPHNYFCSALDQFFAHALPRLLRIAGAEARARQRILN